MREIKFRQPVFNRDGSFSHFHYWGWISEGNFVSPLSMTHRVDGIKGDQFTGLSDKNGVEIYEGDVLNWLAIEKKTGRKVVDENVVVKWQDYGARYIVNLNGMDENLFQNRTRMWEVIGNIHEHPHLLRQEGE